MHSILSTFCLTLLSVALDKQVGVALGAPAIAAHGDGVARNGAIVDALIEEERIVVGAVLTAGRRCVSSPTEIVMLSTFSETGSATNRESITNVLLPAEADGTLRDVLDAVVRHGEARAVPNVQSAAGTASASLGSEEDAKGAAALTSRH